MAIARLASQDATGTSLAATSVSATYAATPTAKNLLIAIVGDNDGSNNATTIAGWNQISPFGNINNSTEVKIFWRVATGAESTTVTATTGTGITTCMAIHEYSGLATSNTFDVTANGGATLATSTISTGTTATTTIVNELVLTAAFTVGLPTFSSWSNGVSLLDTVVNTTVNTLFTGQNIISLTGTQTSTITFTGTTTGSTMIATFKAFVPSKGNLTILGAG